MSGEGGWVCVLCLCCVFVALNVWCVCPRAELVCVMLVEGRVCVMMGTVVAVMGARPVLGGASIATILPL